MPRLKRRAMLQPCSIPRATGEAAREASVQARLCTLLGQLEEVCGNSRKADRQFEMAIGILKDLGNRKN